MSTVAKKRVKKGNKIVYIRLRVIQMICDTWGLDGKTHHVKFLWLWKEKKQCLSFQKIPSNLFHSSKRTKFEDNYF